MEGLPYVFVVYYSGGETVGSFARLLIENGLDRPTQVRFLSPELRRFAE